MSASFPATEIQPQQRGDGGAHLRAMFGWLHRLLAWQIELTRRTYGALADDEYRGLYIPDAEVEILGVSAPGVPPDLAETRLRLAAERDAIEAEARAAEQSGRQSSLLRAARLFGLSAFERDVILLALAPEFDLRYERLYAYIQDDVTKKRPMVDLTLRLLCPGQDERAAARAAFAPEAPLSRHRLIQLFEDGQRSRDAAPWFSTLLSRFIKIDDRIVAELLDQPALDSTLDSFVRLSRPQRPLP